MKSYIVRKYDLNGRWDPYYNHPKFKEIYNTLTKCPFPLSTLKKESSIIFSGTTPLSGGDAYTSQDGIPFIRSGDFSENNMIDFSDVLYLKEEIHNGKMKSSQLKKGDMLIAIVGATIGKVGIYSYDREANINQAICAVRLKELDPYYAQAFFQTNIGQMLIEHIKRPVARANINLEEIGSLLIPKADLEMQQKVVSVIQIATQKKQQKEQQAEALLQSIDGYLLGELGIQLPETKSQTIQDRMFVVNFDKVTGGRFDPKCVLLLGDSAKSTTNKNVQLKQIAKIEKGDSITSDEVNKDGVYPVIAGGQTSPYNHDKYNYKEGIITISASGAYSGYVWYHNYPIFASDCSVIYSKNNQFLTEYLFEVLKAQQSHIYMLQQGAGQPHVYPDDLGNLWIPVVPLSKQHEIVNHISSIRQQAKALQEEGKAILEQAKKEVEQIILG